MKKNPERLQSRQRVYVLVSLLLVLKVVQNVHNVVHALVNDLKVLALAVAESQVDFDLQDRER